MTTNAVSHGHLVSDIMSMGGRSDIFAFQISDSDSVIHVSIFIEIRLYEGVSIIYYITFSKYQSMSELLTVKYIFLYVSQKVP